MNATEVCSNLSSTRAVRISVRRHGCLGPFGCRGSNSDYASPWKVTVVRELQSSICEG